MLFTADMSHLESFTFAIALRVGILPAKVVFAICRFKPAKTGKNSKCIIKLLLAMYFNMRYCMPRVTAVNDQVKWHIDHFNT